MESIFRLVQDRMGLRPQREPHGAHRRGEDDPADGVAVPDAAGGGLLRAGLGIRGRHVLGRFIRKQLFNIVRYCQS